MPLVKEKTYSKWFKKDHFMRKQFDYIYKNALWDKDIPEQYSLCPYFWKSLLVGMILMRFVIVPLGMICKGLGKCMTGVDNILIKMWKSSFEQMGVNTKKDSPTGYEEGAGFMASFISLASISFIFLLTMTLSDIFLFIWSNSLLPGKVILSGVYFFIVAFVSWGIIQNRKMFYSISSLFVAWVIGCLVTGWPYVLLFLTGLWEIIVFGFSIDKGFPWALYLITASLFMYIGHKLLSKEVVWIDNELGTPIDAMTWELNGPRLAYLFAVYAIEDPCVNNIKTEVSYIFKSVDGFHVVRNNTKKYFYKKFIVDIMKTHMCGKNGELIERCSYGPDDDEWTDMEKYYSILKNVDGTYHGISPIRDYFDMVWSLEHKLECLIKDEKNFEKWYGKNKNIIEDVVMMEKGKKHKIDVVLGILGGFLNILYFPARITIVPLFKFIGTLFSYTKDIYDAKKEGFCPLVTLETDTKNDKEVAT